MNKGDAVQAFTVSAVLGAAAGIAIGAAAAVFGATATAALGVTFISGAAAIVGVSGVGMLAWANNRRYEVPVLLGFTSFMAGTVGSALFTFNVVSPGLNDLFTMKAEEFPKVEYQLKGQCDGGKLIDKKLYLPSKCQIKPVAP